MKGWYYVTWTHREQGRELKHGLMTLADSVKEAKTHAVRMWKAKYEGAEKTPRMCGITIREDTNHDET